MKKILSLLSIAALTVGLLGSCSKINERIDNLEKKVDGIENNQIATIGQQIATINQSIADLSTIRTNIQTLMDAKTAMGEDITKLKAADQTLEGKINDLKTYVDKELTKYATKDWANATFATLATQTEIITDVEKLKTDLAGLDDKLDQAIANLDSSLKGWVNGQLSGYYTIAQVDAKVAGIQSDIDALETDNETNKTKIAELESNLATLTQDLEEAKATIKTEYEAAIKKAIEDYNGTITETIQSKIDEVNTNITALTGRVDDLETAVGLLTGRIDAIEAMIQSVSITPAYSDGSVEAVGGILTLKCIVSPAEALIGMESLKDSLLIYADSVKVKTKATTPAYMTIEVSEASVLDAAQGAITLKANISKYLPKGEGKALTVAVNIKNGISDFTTEFVPVYVAGPTLPKGALAGEFSVSATKKVRFSQGNLQATYNSSAYTLGFAANQYDCIGNAAGNTTIDSQIDGAVVDLFGWVGASSTTFTSSPKIYGVSTSMTASDYGNVAVEALKADWGTAIDDKGTWRTLSNGEWKYLLNKHSKKWATVNGVKGYVIAPDGFAGTLSDTYADDAALAANNLVFLPATGIRNGSGVGYVGEGYYWSSTAYGESEAYSVNFDNSSVDPGSYDFRIYGFSVRLVTDVK